MVTRLLVLLLLLMPVALIAQTDIFNKSNTRVKGFVHQMKVRSDMVRMVNDTLVYGENKGIHSYTFNNDGRIISDTSVVDYNHDTLYYAYVYDAANHLVAMRSKTKSILQYTYDGDKLSGMNSLDKKGDTIVHIAYKNFGDSVQMKQVYRGLKTFTSYCTYFYDDKGNNIVVIHVNDSIGAVTISQVFEYDLYDNPVKQTVYNNKGEIEYEYTYEYAYDDRHNFTQRFEYRNGYPFSITKRELVYQ